MKKFQIIYRDTLEKGSKFDIFILCVCAQCKYCKSGAKNHQLPILLILAASLILNTKTCT